MRLLGQERGQRRVAGLSGACGREGLQGECQDPHGAAARGEGQGVGADYDRVGCAPFLAAGRWVDDGPLTATQEVGGQEAEESVENEMEEG